MKAILISDHAKWCALMMNGIKTKEIRKNKALASAIQKLIDKNGYAEIYVYCCKNQELFYELKHNERYYFVANNRKNFRNRLSNGLVVFKFRCYKVGIIHDFDCGLEETESSNRHITISTQEELLNESCLTEEEIRTYGGNYAIHISDLEIFDRAKELSEFIVCTEKNHKCNKPITYPCRKCVYMNELTKAPQNFCYIEVE